MTLTATQKTLIAESARKAKRHFCTCRWSAVNSTTIDPPDIVKVDPDCPFHGHEAPPEPDPDEAYERHRDDADFFQRMGWDK